MFKRVALALVSLVVSVQAFAQIAYTVKADNEQSRLNVTLSFAAKADVTTVQLPSWAPGAYVLSISGNNVKDLAAKDAKGAALAITPVDSNTWNVATKGAKHVTLSYWINQLGMKDYGHWSGPSTYVYLVGRKEEKCSLNLELPADWKHACGLDAGLLPNTYVAPDYDVLADNPVSVGKIAIDEYTVDGVPHQIVYRRGEPPAELDRQKVLNACKHITQSQFDFWGARPFKKYVWHFQILNAPNGGGGLEHLSSTQIQLASGMGQGTVSVLSHEYFHAWNVKRNRSFVLGPFDYTQLPMTGALWWLEGVTDYYADVLLHRYGYFDEAYFLGNILSNTQTLRRNPARLEISPFFSSWRVREASGRRGNSNGYKISYYTLGWVAGLCLDIEIRSRTKGRFSLDDVSRHLYEQCLRSGKGFQEGDIKNVLMKYGGPEMGDIYEKWIMQPGELPVEAQIAKMGLKWVPGEGNAPAKVEVDPNATPAMKKLREGWYSGGRAKIPVGK